ncbi:MAG: hypothetical protein ACKO7W_11500 [Elainella sp.]
MISSQKQLSRKLLQLLNTLSDFDGVISPEAAAILETLRYRPAPIPPLYADTFGLAPSATCADLVDRIEACSNEQRAVASYAFQIFWSYEQMLRVQPAQSSEQQAAYQSQLEQVRLQVARTRRILAETLAKRN